MIEGFRRRVEEAPDRSAIVHGDDVTTYGALGSLVNRLAAVLTAAGVERGDRVAVFAPKSAAAIAAFYGCLGAGAVYVPVDLANPADRIARMMKVSGATAAVASAQGGDVLEATCRALDDWSPIVVSLDRPSQPGSRIDVDAADIGAADDSPVTPIGGPDDAAQIMFTSGSTGLPKGVSVRHGNVTHFVEWSIEYFGISPEDRLSGHPPFYFDLSTFDLYVALAAGAELHLVSPALNMLPHRLADFIAEHELTVWNSVPTTLTQLASSGAIAGVDLPRLRHVLWCGESIPIPTLRTLMELLPRTRFTNLYGPTETTCASSYYPVTNPPDPDLPSVPIGVAIPGEELMILSDGDTPADVGEVGELAIGGAGVTIGYWNDPSRTDEVFRTRPDGSRYYMTGDLAKIGADGEIYLLGRADDQIKARGNRVELGEIEAALHRVPGVAGAAVVAVTTNVEEGSTICCALVLGGDREHHADEGVRAVRRELGTLLPRYMIPRRWRVMDEIPKNANGKADRERLRKWFAREASADMNPGSSPPADTT
jgi:amino acid adenylation domain-containing protein